MSLDKIKKQKRNEKLKLQRAEKKLNVEGVLGNTGTQVASKKLTVLKKEKKEKKAKKIPKPAPKYTPAIRTIMPKDLDADESPEAQKVLEELGLSDSFKVA